MIDDRKRAPKDVYRKIRPKKTAASAEDDDGLSESVECEPCAGRETPVCIATCPNEALVLSIDGHSGDKVK